MARSDKQGQSMPDPDAQRAAADRDENVPGTQEPVRTEEGAPRTETPESPAAPPQRSGEDASEGTAEQEQRADPSFATERLGVGDWPDPERTNEDSKRAAQDVNVDAARSASPVNEDAQRAGIEGGGTAPNEGEGAPAHVDEHLYDNEGETVGETSETSETGEIVAGDPIQPGGARTNAPGGAPEDVNPSEAGQPGTYNYDPATVDAPAREQPGRLHTHAPGQEPAEEV